MYRFNSKKSQYIKDIELKTDISELDIKNGYYQATQQKDKIDVSHFAPNNIEYKYVDRDYTPEINNTNIKNDIKLLDGKNNKDEFISNSLYEKWSGAYSLKIDYGKLDEFSEMAIDYDIKISTDKCIFSGMGYKTDFTDLCKIEEKGNELVLKFIKSIDGDGFTDHSNLDILGTIIYRNGKYYLKSPIVYDKDWNCNVEIQIEKK